MDAKFLLFYLLIRWLYHHIQLLLSRNVHLMNVQIIDNEDDKKYLP